MTQDTSETAGIRRLIELHEGALPAVPAADRPGVERVLTALRPALMLTEIGLNSDAQWIVMFGLGQPGGDTPAVRTALAEQFLKRMAA